MWQRERVRSEATCVCTATCAQKKREHDEKSQESDGHFWSISDSIERKGATVLTWRRKRRYIHRSSMEKEEEVEEEELSRWTRVSGAEV